MWNRLLSGIALLVVASRVCAAGNDVLVDNAWLGESVPGQTTASLQLRLTATRPAMLLAVDTPLAGAVQIQRVWPYPGGVKVHVLHRLRLARNRTVSFGEGRLSLMLIGLKAQLFPQEGIPLTLTVRLAGGHLEKLTTQAKVRPLELSYRHYRHAEVYDH